MTGPRIGERRDDEELKRVQRVYLMRTSEDNISIIQGAKVIGRLLWEKKVDREPDKSGYSLG
jgi:hypothetical protein